MGERIKQERRSHNISQSELAVRSGLSMASIRRYESGERIPKVSDAEKIADALGVTVYFLMGRTSFRDIGGETWANEDGRTITYSAKNYARLSAEEREKIEDELTQVSMINKTREEYEKKILFSFNMLSDSGKDEAIKRVGEMTMLEEYSGTRVLD
jgi:transcriptional regulator with XRE-family HTH domain